MAVAPAPPQRLDPDKTENLHDMEKQLAVKAVHHLTTYWKILESIRGSTLRLTKLDADILDHLYRDFPDFDPAAPLDEDAMKSKEGKEKWRTFMMQYESKVTDYNFGTILRVSPTTEYDQETTIFVPRMQFYAIEIARNKKGLNDWIYERGHPREGVEGAKEESRGAKEETKETEEDTKEPKEETEETEEDTKETEEETKETKEETKETEKAEKAEKADEGAGEGGS